MRNPALDIVRLLAVVLVLGRHFNETMIVGSPTLLVWQRGGWVGVDLFFVLSGYLISGLIFQEWRSTGSFACRRFLIRRAFKIYPAFWVLTVCTVAYRFGIAVDRGSGIRAAAEPLVEPTIIELLFLQSYWFGLWNHTWSLAVEEHFYIGLAAIVVWGIRRHPASPFRVLPVAFGVCAVGCLLMRWHAALQPGELTFYDTFFATHLRVDSLMFGVVLRQASDALPSQFATSRRAKVGLVLGGLACLSPAFMFEKVAGSPLLVFAPPLLAFGAGLLVFATRQAEQSVRQVPPVVSCVAGAGACSYSTYLWHEVVDEVAVRVTCKWFTCSCPVYVALYVAGSLLAGYAMFRLVELPALRVRERFFPSRRRPATRT